MEDTLDQQLEGILRMHLPGVPDGQTVPMDEPLAKLGLDSLRAVSLVLDIEDSFDVEFPDGLLSEATFKTGAALRNGLRALLSDGVESP